jgi:hypothetical protein
MGGNFAVRGETASDFNCKTVATTQSAIGYMREMEPVYKVLKSDHIDTKIDILESKILLIIHVRTVASDESHYEKNCEIN